MLEQVLVHEQLGQATGGLWSFIPGAYNALIHCDAEQRRRYLDPSLRGERFGSYAITEPGAGSDARALAATAVRDAATGEYVLNGEKWFVTGPPDETDFMIFHCLVVDGDERRPTLFLVDYDTPGVTIAHDPDYMHTFADRHPQFVLDGRPRAGLGDPRRGRAGRRAHQRVVRRGAHPHRCALHRRDGAAADAAPSSGRPSGSSSASGSSTSRACRSRWPIRPPTRRRPGCSPARRPGSPTPGADPKVVHAKASLAKLFASEAAFRCADRVVQVFGGRGYMREYPAERFFRELRVDRIWEGTSEIQRLIIARALEKRGVDRVVG